MLCKGHDRGLYQLCGGTLWFTDEKSARMTIWFHLSFRKRLRGRSQHLTQVTEWGQFYTHTHKRVHLEITSHILLLFLNLADYNYCIPTLHGCSHWIIKYKDWKIKNKNKRHVCKRKILKKKVLQDAFIKRPKQCNMLSAKTSIMRFICYVCKLFVHTDSHLQRQSANPELHKKMVLL